MKNFKLISSIVLATTLTAGMTSAHACTPMSNLFSFGDYRCLVSQIERHTRSAEERLNEEPLAVPTFKMKAIVPGTGTDISEKWMNQQRTLILDDLFEQHKTPPFFPIKVQNVGNFCSTPAGRFGPGPIDDLGKKCWAHSTYGVVYGTVSR